jgi:protein-tyrosine phosphatase
MSFWSRLFGNSDQASEVAAAKPVLEALGADMHSHVLPGLDDGADTVEASLALLRELHALGYRKLIATPHIMGDFYKNTPTGVRAALATLQAAATEHQMEIELCCAAEYYLDEWFLPRLERGDELLSFGGNKKYLLLETSYINESRLLNETIFELKAAGYQPVIAHPERYKYLHGRIEELPKWRDKGALLQLNLNSLAGYYGPGERQLAEQMVDQKLVDFAGTDAHGLKHTGVLRHLGSAPYFRKLMALPLRNQSLLSEKA